MSLLLAQIGGGGGSVTAAIGWTTENANHALTGTVSVTAAAAWTTDNAVSAVTGTVSVTGTAAWTTDNATHALAGTVTVDGAVAWATDDAVWAITGDVGGSVTAAIDWTTDDTTWAVDAQVETPEEQLFGGVDWRPRKKRQSEPEAVAELFGPDGIETLAQDLGRPTEAPRHDPLLSPAIAELTAADHDDLLTILLLAA